MSWAIWITGVPGRGKSTVARAATFAEVQLVAPHVWLDRERAVRRHRADG